MLDNFPALFSAPPNVETGASPPNDPPPTEPGGPNPPPFGKAQGSEVKSGGPSSSSHPDPQGGICSQRCTIATALYHYTGTNCAVGLWNAILLMFTPGPARGPHPSPRLCLHPSLCPHPSLCVQMEFVVNLTKLCWGTTWNTFLSLRPTSFGTI